MRRIEGSRRGKRDENRRIGESFDTPRRIAEPVVVAAAAVVAEDAVGAGGSSRWEERRRRAIRFDDRDSSREAPRRFAPLASPAP